jgi:diguanylate cyclase (GGDEF)-like protein
MSTSRLIQGVAESTLQRDRNQLDLATVRLLSQFFRAYSVTLYHLLEHEGSVRLVKRAATTREGGEEFPAPFSDPASLPMLSEVPVCHDCTTLDRVVEGITGEGRLLTAFPLHAKATVLGAVIVESAESLPVPHIDLIHGILRIVENHVALLDYGERDTLTGLLNRKTFDAYFDQVRRRVSSTQATDSVMEPSWLALVDIDHFKSINDRHGHLFGDEVLLLVSQLMTLNFRGADHIFRFGGEEFLIVLDHASEIGAHIALDRLRGAIEAHRFPQIGRVTVSLGYTQIRPEDVGTICVERADNALYYAKAHGRNCLQNYESLIRSGALISKSDTATIELF